MSATCDTSIPVILTLNIKMHPMGINNPFYATLGKIQGAGAGWLLFHESHPLKRHYPAIYEYYQNSK